MNAEFIVMFFQLRGQSIQSLPDFISHADMKMVLRFMNKSVVINSPNPALFLARIVFRNFPFVGKEETFRTIKAKGISC